MRDEQLLIWNDYPPRVVAAVVREELWGGGAPQTCAGCSSASCWGGGFELEEKFLAHVTAKVDFPSFYKTLAASVNASVVTPLE